MRVCRRAVSEAAEMTPSLVLVAAVSAAQLAMPAAAGAQQFWKKIKDQTEKKVEARVAKADSTATARVSQSVDSTLSKTGRGVDTLRESGGRARRQGPHR